MNIRVFYSTFLLLTLLIFSCTKDQATDPNASGCNTPVNPSYQNDVFPIIQATCALEGGCHGQNAPVGDFTNYESTLEDLENGKIENQAIITGAMPIGGIEPLTNCEVQILQTWIDQDYPNN